MSSQRIKFGYKQLNRQRNNLKLTPKEFLDEQYTDFSQQNTKKRTRE
jgi:hypothetical protein